MREKDGLFRLAPILELFQKHKSWQAQPAIHTNAIRNIQVVMTVLHDESDHKITLIMCRFLLMSWILDGHFEGNG